MSTPLVVIERTPQQWNYTRIVDRAPTHKATSDIYEPMDAEWVEDMRTDPEGLIEKLSVQA